MKCNICEGEIIRQCKCMRKDVVCENGHSYHWSPFHEEYHTGISDHATNTLSADCCKDKEKLKGE